jgi:Flp pilus assembly protein TadG
MTRRLRSDEGGAVLVLVALGLVVILGMLALTLDLGRAVAVKRDMVNAADAAALAGAQQCALGRGAAAAQAAATQTAGLNGAENTVLFDAGEECDDLQDGTPKLVSVTYGKVMDYYVAPILGFDSVTINASATALWGAATRSAPIPLRVDINALLDCGVNPTTDDQVTCYLPFANNDPEGASNDWGWLYFGGDDGSGWDTTDCSSQANGANDPISFLEGDPFFNAELNDPPPTYVCSYSGNAQSVVNSLIGREGDMLTFPIVDPVTYPVLGSGANLAWPVITFAKLRLIAVYDQPDAATYCPGLEDAPGQDEFCLQLRWEGPQPGGSGPGEDIPYFGVPAVQLVR